MTFPSRITWTDNFHYLDVPVRAVMQLGRGPFRSITGLGMSASYLLAKTTTSKYEYADGRTERTTQENKLNSFADFGLFPFASTGLACRIGAL